MSELNKLEQEFVNRYSNYQRNTMQIFKLIPNVLEGIHQALTSSEYDNLKWEDIQYTSEDRVLILIGNVKLAVGDRMQLDSGKVVNITEENVDTLRRLVRVGIPLDLAESGSVDNVIDYISNNTHRDYEELTDDPQNVDELLTEEQVNKYYKESIGEAAELVLGFDTEGLTEDQIEQMMLNMNSRKIH